MVNFLETIALKWVESARASRAVRRAFASNPVRGSLLNFAVFPLRLAKFAPFLLLISASLPVLAVTFTATLDRNSTSVGDSVNLNIVCTEGAINGVPSPPPIPGLSVAFSGQSSSTIFANGKLTRSDSFGYVLTPTRAGDFTIPAIEAEIDGRPWRTQPLTLKVTAADPNELARIAFLKLVAPKPEIFLGEVLPIEVRLYATGGRFSELPIIKGDDFIFGKMAIQPQQATTYGNQNYGLVPFLNYIVAAKTGDLELGPATLNVIIPRPNARANVFGQIDPRDLRTFNLTSETNFIRVLPVPIQNAPPGFNGAVGQYSVSFSAGPTNLGLGDPITVRIRISGRGMLESLSLPEQPAWRDFKVYPASAKIEANDGFNIQGSKSFEQVITPQSADLHALPPFQFSFFDPAQKKFMSTTSPPIPLTIRPTAATPQPTILTTGTNAPAPEEIVHIKPSLGILSVPTTPLIGQRWFLLLQFVPPLAWIASLLWRRRRDKIAANPKLRRRRDTARFIRANLQKLRDLAAANEHEQFFATLFRLLQEKVGDRLDLPASSITEAVLEERSASAGLSEPAVGLLRELFQICNQARYARQPTREELTSLIAKVERAFHTLDKT